MSHTARIFTQEQLTDALASACVLEGVSHPAPFPASG